MFFYSFIYIYLYIYNKHLLRPRLPPRYPRWHPVCRFRSGFHLGVSSVAWGEVVNIGYRYAFWIVFREMCIDEGRKCVKEGKGREKKKLTKHNPLPTQLIPRPLSAQLDIPLCVIGADIKRAQRHDQDDFHLEHGEFLTDASARTFFKGAPSVFWNCGCGCGCGFASTCPSTCASTCAGEESLRDEFVGLGKEIAASLDCVQVYPYHVPVRRVCYPVYCHREPWHALSHC